MRQRRVQIALVLACALAAYGLAEAAPTIEPAAAAPAPAPAGECRAQAPADLALWERDLPTAKVPAGAAASDPSCVTEVGRTANGVVWRNPNGSLTSRVYPTAVNFRAADGSWRAIDTRLDDDGKGGLANRAGPVSVKLGADAASSALVRVGSGDRSVSFGLKGQARATGPDVAPTKSTPVVQAGESRDAVEYAATMPRVDVRYQTLPWGVKEDIVLTQAPTAGTKPEFTFAMRTDGLQAATLKDGSIELRDSSTNDVVFTIPVGVASDSSDQPATTGVNYVLVPTGEAGVSNLTVSIDPKWLADPDRVFPVFIDPTVTAVYAHKDAYVDDGAPNTTHNGSAQYDGATGQYRDYAGHIFSKARSFIKFPLVGLVGSTVVDASFHAYAYGGSNPPTTITLQPVGATGWEPDTITWNNQPGVRTNSLNWSYSTPNTWFSADVTTWAQNWLALSGTVWERTGIRLSGPTSGGKSAWFAAQESSVDKQPYINLTYYAAPILSGLTAGGQYEPGAVPTGTPTLSAKITDVDTSTGLFGHFEVDTATPSGPPLQSGTGSAVASGNSTSWQVPTALSHGTYSWRVQGDDGNAKSAWSAWQTLEVDLNAPPTPTGGMYGITANTWYTAGGSDVAFFQPNGVSDVIGYLWGIDVGDNPTDFIAGSTPTTALFAPTWGWRDLAFRSIDNAGNLSSVKHFIFGWGYGGFTKPETDFTTQKRVTTAISTKKDFDGIKLQWRHAEATTWADVPVGNVTYQSTGNPVTAWPVTTTPGSITSTFPTLIWDAATTAGGADGPLQLQFVYYTNTVNWGALTAASSLPNVSLDQAAYGAGFASAPAGPGQVNLLTGNLQLSATDVAVPGGGVSRTFQSRSPNAAGSVFGPGWSSNIMTGDAPYRVLTDNTDNVVITSADGSELGFRKQTDGSYVAQDNPDTFKLTKDTSPTRFTLKLLDFETFTFKNIDTGTPTIYQLTDVDDSSGFGAASTLWEVNGGVTRPTRMVAPTAPGVTCATPLTTRGCMTLTFDYATSTTASGTSEANWGDYIGRLKTVHYTAWDPDLGTPAMRTVDVASYLYDSNGRLRAAWDPRISPALKTKYDYNSNDQISTVTPPGLNAWSFAYAPLSGEPANTGRVSTVSRPALPSGTATATFVYAIPLTTAAGGAYNLDVSTIASWGQHDAPTDATAVYPPDQTPSGTPPSSYTRASVYYMNVEQELVNVAEPGGSISTTEHDSVGNVIRMLGAANRDPR